MGYGTSERILAEGALFTWLTDSAGLPEGKAHGMANSLANRPQLVIKRRALMNVLDTFAGHDRAVEFFGTLIQSHVLELQKGDADHPQPADSFVIHPPADESNQKSTEDKPAPRALHPRSTFLRTRMRELTRAPLQMERNLGKLCALDRWLAQAEVAPPDLATTKQRAHEIFNDEKALDEHLDGSFDRMLKRLGVDDAVLGIADLKRPSLEVFTPHRAKGPILVVENGDSFESLRFTMGERGRTRVLGQRLGGVVYGAGGSVCTPGLLDQTLRHIGYTLPYVLYWGDIDRSGVSEIVRAREVNTVQIRLARPLYRKMVQLQKARERMGIEAERSCRQTFPGGLEEVAREVPLSARWTFLQTIREGKRIPQEIVQLRDLLDD